MTLVANHGVEGDYHAGAFVRHRRRAEQEPQQPNLRQVHLMHSELFDELAPIGITVTPGAMGENITTRGLRILDLPPGTRMHIGESAVIEITGLRNPCNQLDSVDKRLLRQVAMKADDGSIIRKAGIMGVVLEGGIVRPGDAIRSRSRLVSRARFSRSDHPLSLELPVAPSRNARRMRRETTMRCTSSGPS